MGKSKVNLYTVSKANKQEERIDDALKLLGLEGMRFAFQKLAERSIQDQGTPYDFLEALMEKEIHWKEENRLQRWIQQAKFPYQRSLEDFDFSFQPSLNKRQIYELASCRFIERCENVVFFGPPGVGKTHLAVALGFKAIDKGYETRFVTLGQLIDLVEKAGGGEALRRVFSLLMRQKLLIIDEMDLYEVRPEVSDFLFKLFHQRYEQASVIFTSNKTFTDWGKIFGGQARAGTIIDRVTHHCTIINIEGESYRLKDKMERGS